jgi:hypothetical protein
MAARPPDFESSLTHRPQQPSANYHREFRKLSAAMYGCIRCVAVYIGGSMDHTWTTRGRGRGKQKPRQGGVLKCAEDLTFCLAGASSSHEHDPVAVRHSIALCNAAQIALLIVHAGACGPRRRQLSARAMSAALREPAGISVKSRLCTASRMIGMASFSSHSRALPITVPLMMMVV